MAVRITRRRIIWATAAAVVAACGYSAWLITRPYRVFRHFIRRGDHAALLAACRDLIRRRREFLPSDEPEGSPSGASVRGTDARLPAVIRELEPVYVTISANHVRIAMSAGFEQFGYKGYAAGEDPESGGGLIPGLYTYGRS